MHRLKHAVELSVKVKENNSIAIKIVPIAEVVAKLIASSTIEVSIPESIPIRVTGKTFLMHLHIPKFLLSADIIRVMLRYTTDTPSTTHKKAGVTVIIPVKLSIAAVIPTIILDAIDIIRHSFLLLQQQLFIHFSPPDIFYAYILHQVILSFGI